ncbi:MAG: HIT family protein [Terriglobales bacterium]
MDYLFSPWRYRYVSEARAGNECVLCQKLAARDDEANFILHRGRHNAVMLNLYPYTSGHMMILPFAHVARLGDCDAAARAEMIEIAARGEQALEREYRPEGINLGMNLGAAAGAGIAGHLHLHLLPRWMADANFMTVVGETRVLPEALSDSYRRLRPYFLDGA